MLHDRDPSTNLYRPRFQFRDAEYIRYISDSTNWCCLCGILKRVLVGNSGFGLIYTRRASKLWNEWWLAVYFWLYRCTYTANLSWFVSSWPICFYFKVPAN